MAATDQIKSAGLVTFNIKVDGTAISQEIRVYAVHIESGINRIPRATITILDGNVSTEKFEVSSSKTFVPGNKVTIEAGYDSENKTIFRGVVTSQNISINNDIGSALTVECRDEARKLVIGR